MTGRTLSAVRHGAVICTLLLPATACGGRPGVPPSDSGGAASASAPTDAAALDSTEWLLSSLHGRPPVPGSRVTLTFEGQSVGGYGGCNWYGSRFTATDSGIRIGSAESTARACGIPAGVLEQETRFLAALARVSALRVVGGRLEMADSARNVLAVLDRRVPAPMDPAALAGTRWRLRSMNDTLEDGQDPPITLRLTTTGIGGFAGCRAYTGTYTARGDHIGVTSIGMASTECGRGEGALLREGRFTTDLSEASLYRLSGDTLEIVTHPGRRLLFVTAP